MILWKHHVSKDFPSGRQENSGVGEGGLLHEDLGKLIDYCRKDGRDWSIARIECIQADVEPDNQLGPGWYKARHTIISQEGFIPLEEAQRRYLKHE